MNNTNIIWAMINIMIWPFTWFVVVYTERINQTVPTWMIIGIGIMAYYAIQASVKTLINEGRKEAERWQMKQA